MAWAGNKWGSLAWGGAAWVGTQWGVNSGITTTPVTFTVTAGQTVTIGLAVKAGTTAVINWGDGTTTSVTNSGSHQDYTRTYAASGTYAGYISNVGMITHLRMSSEAKARFDFTRFRSLTYLYLYNTESSVTGVITGMALTYLYLFNIGSSVTGVITGMALTYLHLFNIGSSVTGVITGMALTYLHLYNTESSVTGVITGMALTYLRLSNTGSSVTGAITGMALTYLYLFNTGSSVTGVITGMALTYLHLSNIGSSVTGTLNSTARLTREYIDITGEITLPTNRVYGTWGSESMRIDMDAHKLTADETAATLIRLAASPISGANKTVYIYGNYPTESVELDAAWDVLATALVSVIITG